MCEPDAQTATQKAAQERATLKTPSDPRLCMPAHVNLQPPYHLNTSSMGKWTVPLSTGIGGGGGGGVIFFSTMCLVLTGGSHPPLPYSGAPLSE